MLRYVCHWDFNSITINSNDGYIANCLIHVKRKVNDALMKLCYARQEKDTLISFNMIIMKNKIIRSNWS
jgi:hypothetical protein